MLGAILHRQGLHEAGLAAMAAVLRLLQTLPVEADVVGAPEAALGAKKEGHDEAIARAWARS